VLFLTGIFEELPQASLAAVVIVAAAGLVDLDGIRALGRIRGSAILLAAVTVSGVLLLGVLGGVLIGVIVSMLGLFARLNRPGILVVERSGGELVARIDGPVYFANAGYVHTQLLAIADAAPSRPRTLVLDLVAVSDTDVTALLRVPALERDLSVRTIGLQFENASPRLVELARRTPGLSDRC
jgi:SulP family sulfate permease